MTMVERMARAMFRADFDGYHPQFIWEKAHEEVHAKFLAMAVASLRELREPTEVMAGAAASAVVMRAYPHKILTAAIDAAIAEHEASR